MNETPITYHELHDQLRVIRRQMRPLKLAIEQAIRRKKSRAKLWREFFPLEMEAERIALRMDDWIAAKLAAANLNGIPSVKDSEPAKPHFKGRFPHGARKPPKHED